MRLIDADALEYHEIDEIGGEYNPYLGCSKEYIDRQPTIAQPCEDAVSRQAVLALVADYDLSMGEVVKGIHALQPVTPQQKMGCEGCIYEKTGNNSTYPCSHCSRCYTDKYKAESEDKE